MGSNVEHLRFPDGGCRRRCTERPVFPAHGQAPIAGGTAPGGRPGRGLSPLVARGKGAVSP